MNPKIGTINDDGTITYPTETLAGAHFERGQFDPAPAITYNLGAHYVAIGDVWPPRGFDVQAALDTLKAEVAALSAPTKTGKTGKTDRLAIGFEAGE